MHRLVPAQSQSLQLHPVPKQAQVLHIGLQPQQTPPQ